jgi:hypothetical protein
MPESRRTNRARYKIASIGAKNASLSANSVSGNTVPVVRIL